jgi:aryl-alcohol dehydrogenase-like predicted oxidoreductase
MKRIQITNGMEVSAVCLGAMDFGTAVGKKTSFEILDAFLDRGGNFIDTANNYAHWAGTGDESETLLGEWLTERKCRDRVVLATKVGFDRHGKGAGLTRKQIEFWCDESLRKLKTDYIDLYYAHTDDFDTPMEETLDAFNTLVRKGKVRVLGGSNYDTWRFSEFNCLAEEKGLRGYEVMQQMFSYLYTRGDAAPKHPFNEYANRERLRYLSRYDIPLVAYACLAKGGFADVDRMPGEYILGKRYETLTGMAQSKGISASRLVLAWMLHLGKANGFPRVIPLFSAQKMAHLLDSLHSVEVSLSDEEMEILLRA